LFDHDLRFDHFATTKVEIILVNHFLQWVMHQALDEELLLSLLLLNRQPVSAPVAIAHVLRHEAAEHATQHGGSDDGNLEVIRVAASEADHGDFRQLATAITTTATTNSQRRFVFHVGLRATGSSGEIFMATSS
jgi:hypothetical protein